MTAPDDRRLRAGAPCAIASREARLKVIVGKRRQKPFASGGAKSAAGVGLVEQPQDGGRQLVVASRAARIDDEAGDVVLDDFRRGARAADAGLSRAHRLEKHEAEALVAARHHEEAALRVQAGQRVVADAADEAHRVCQAERRGPRLEPPTIVAVAGDHEPRVRTAREHVGPDVEQRVVTLVAFGRRHPRDDQARSDDGACGPAAALATRQSRMADGHISRSKRRIRLLEAIDGVLGNRHERGPLERPPFHRPERHPRLDAAEHDRDPSAAPRQQRCGGRQVQMAADDVGRGRGLQRRSGHRSQKSHALAVGTAHFCMRRQHAGTARSIVQAQHERTAPATRAPSRATAPTRRLCRARSASAESIEAPGRGHLRRRHARRRDRSSTC